jgi:hypothetical protein
MTCCHYTRRLLEILRGRLLQGLRDLGTDEVIGEYHSYIEAAQAWHENRFTVITAHPWWMAGCYCAETAAKLRDKGIKPTKETP